MSDSNQIDLKHLIEQHPEVLTDHTKLKAYILDLYPNCKRGMVNILVTIQQCGIVAEMQASKKSSALDMGRWKKCLEDDVGFTGALADTCLQMWCSAFGIQLEIKETKDKDKHRVVLRQKNGRTPQTLLFSKLQNDQKDWFEYDGTILLRINKEHKNCREIYISDGVTRIGVGAFSGCDYLMSVIIPDSVTSIGEYAFNDCKSLSSITIPDSVMSIGTSAFSGCRSLIQIEEGVSYVDKWSIACSGFTNITLRRNTVGIADEAFSFCSKLMSITIPCSVKSIGEGIFFGPNCHTSITVEAGNIRYHSSGNCLIETASNTLIAGCMNSMIPTDGSVTSIAPHAFVFNSPANITVPDSVTTIGDYAFSACANLRSITIPDGVTSIGKGAFYSSSLANIIIPNGVMTIEEKTFECCKNLTSITVPNGVTSIGRRALKGCNRLISIYFIGTKAHWKAIKKEFDWDDNTGSYIVHCTNGDIPKSKS